MQDMYIVMKICAIDPGVSNFALSIENVDNELASGVCDPLTLLLCSETEYFANVSLNSPVKTHTQVLTQFFESINHLLAECDVVLVERQMQFKAVINNKALRIAHHCLSYFEIVYPSIKVVDYMASNKTRTLGAPKGLSKPERKKWSVQTVNTILEWRGATHTLALRNELACKLDDVSDCMLMCLSYMIVNAYNAKTVKKLNFKSIWE